MGLYSSSIFGSSPLDTVLYTLGVLFFVGFLALSIALHEYGHYYFAKKFGTKVTHFFVGFGKTVWSRKRGETEYGIKLIPLGGFVKIVGMIPPNKDDDPDKIRESTTGLFTQAITEAKHAEYEDLSPQDRERVFYRLPWWKKFIVMGAGPMMNLVIAYLVFLGVFGLYGNRTEEPVTNSTTIGTLTECVDPSFTVQLTCDTEGAVPSPAAEGGLKAGDSVVSFNGVALTDWDDLADAINSGDGSAATLVVNRDGVEKTLTMTPVAKGDEYRIGVAPVYETVVTRGGPIYTLNYMGETTVEVVKILGTLPPKIMNVAKAIVGEEERDPAGPISVVGGSRIAGEVVAMEPEVLSTGDKIAYLFLMGASFNLFLGVFNLLPLLPLDGGHMVGALWEGIRNKFATLRKKELPPPVDITKMMPIGQAFAYVLFIMSMVLIVGDFVVPVTLR